MQVILMVCKSRQFVLLNNFAEPLRGNYFFNCLSIKAHFNNFKTS